MVSFTNKRIYEGRRDLKHSLFYFYAVFTSSIMTTKRKETNDMSIYNGYCIGNGRCSECPFWALEGKDGCRCLETNQDVYNYVLSREINKGCPIIEEK